MSDPTRPEQAGATHEAPTPTVTIYPETRWYLRCEACGDLRQSVIVSGHTSEEDAAAAAARHTQRHAEQPRCVCATTCTDLSVDHDCDRGECGHTHCRHHAICCDCGCVTRTPA